jgi:hypothetical protein
MSLETLSKKFNNLTTWGCAVVLSSVVENTDEILALDECVLYEGSKLE